MDEALRYHEDNKGKIEVNSKVRVENKEQLSLAYTPGVAKPCIEIAKNPEDVYRYTAKGNLVAVISDGSAVLGLGNIGPKAAIPVMEGKCVLFKEFAGVDAFPICLDTQDTDELVRIITTLAPSFGGINLEDISAPRCFEIERRVQENVDIPVFHDDQHGTAIVAAAASINALKLVGKKCEDIKMVINGDGAAGTAILKMFLSLGIKNILVCDKEGILQNSRELYNDNQKWIASVTNPNNEKGDLSVALSGADLFIGVSAPNIVSESMIKSMANDSIVFPMANPVPEIMPELALKAGARIVGTGRSDFKNQINNVLAFPGIFRGALNSRAPKITEEMKKAAVYAIASCVSDEELSDDFIIPSIFNKDVTNLVAKAVSEASK